MVVTGSSRTRTVSSTSELGDPGCCASESNFTVELDCDGTLDSSAWVYMGIVDPTHTAVCEEYTLTFHF